MPPGRCFSGSRWLPLRAVGSEKSTFSPAQESRRPGRVGWPPDRAAGRPALYGAMFWVTVVVVSAAEVTNFARQPQPYGLWPLVCLGVLTVAWLAMPWDPTAPLPRKLALFPFIGGMLALSLLSSYNSTDIWLLLALANCTFVFGVRATVIIAASFVAFTFVDTLTYPGYTVLAACIQSLVVLVLTVFVTGLASAVTEARRRRTETQRLLGELAEAHQELRAYADQVRELSIIERHQGGPVGLETLAAALAEDTDAIEDIYEPFLMQIGFLNRTPRGRVATQLAYDHLGIKPNRRQQASLF